MNRILCGIPIIFLYLPCAESQQSDPDCPRYMDAMEDSSAVAILEAWRDRLPKKFDKSEYPRVYESSGFGGYSFSLDFDPAALNLGPSAHAEVSVDPDSKKIALAAISDAKSTGFLFRFDGYEYRFESRAMKSPRSGSIGVACSERNGQD